MNTDGPFGRPCLRYTAGVASLRRVKVLFLPGLDGEPRSMHKVQPHLKRVEMVPFAYPTGRTLKWDELTDLVASKLASLESGLIAGESFGGAVAQQTAILQRGAVTSICLLGSFNHEAEPIAASIGRSASRLLPKVVLNPVARLLANWKLAGNLQGEERRKFLEFFESLDHAELARRLELLKGFDVSDRLVGIRCHVEILYGSDDRISADPRQLNMWDRLPDKSIHCLDGAGHVLCAEVPIGVARRIDAWAEAAYAT